MKAKGWKYFLAIVGALAAGVTGARSQSPTYSNPMLRTNLLSNNTPPLGGRLMPGPPGGALPPFASHFAGTPLGGQLGPAPLGGVLQPRSTGGILNSSTGGRMNGLLIAGAAQPGFTAGTLGPQAGGRLTSNALGGLLSPTNTYPTGQRSIIIGGPNPAATQGGLLISGAPTPLSAFPGGFLTNSFVGSPH